MKIKTSELTGSALCYAVCMIEMPHLVWGETIGEHHASRQIVVPELAEPKCYSPFMNWEMFGPIIEREKITVVCAEGDYNPSKAGTPDCFNTHWVADIGRLSSDQSYGPQGDYWGEHFSIDTGCVTGPTPLIAAMRCFVASALGDEIEIPEELCE